MSTKVGSIDLELLLNSKQFNKQLKSVNGMAKNTSNTVSSSLSKIGKVALAAFSVKKIFDFGKECVNLGSDLAEVQNVVDVSFKTMSESVNQFAENAIDQFGLGQTVTKKYMGTFGAMSKAFGFAEKDAFEMSKTLTGLAGDVASFYNLSSDEAYTKLKSVFTGETETLKDLGVVMTQNALDQYALANGYGKTTSAMSEQEKVALRYKFVIDQLSLASGDFARTQDSWANQTRVLSLRFNEFKATIGQGFINLFTPIVKVINAVLAKLQVLANAFKSFTELITGKKQESTGSLGGVSSDLSSVADSATNASGAVGGIGKSAKKAAKDLKSLASFDTAQILQDNKDDSSDDSGGSGGAGGINFGDTSSLTDSIEESSQLLNPFLEKMKELAGIFKAGFSISFGNTNFDGILDHFMSIKNAIIDVFTDSKVLNSASNWINTCLYSLGQAVGSIARIGTNIAEGLIGSIDKYLLQNSSRIKNFITNMFNISSKDIALKGNLLQVLGEISDVFAGDTAKQIGADIISMFANPIMSVSEFLSKFTVDLKSIFIQPIIDNAKLIKSAIENTLKPIQVISGTLAEAFTYVGDKLNEMYDAHLQPLLESIKTGLSDTFSKFLEVYNTYVVPFLDNVANGIATLWEEHLKPFVDKIGAFIGSIADAIQLLWNSVLKPVVDWIIQNIIPSIIPVIEGIWNSVMKVFGYITDTIGGIIDVLRGLIDFVVGIFTGDWNKAWEGIKTTFIGIWETLKGIVSAAWSLITGIISNAVNGIKATITTVFQAVWDTITTIFSRIGSFFSNVWNNVKNTFSNLGTSIGNAISNAVKSGINGVISLIEKTINRAIGMINGAIGVINAIPGVNISKLSNLSLPRLAEGGYVKANQPQLVMVGDNKRHGEIIAPEDKLEAIYRKVMSETGLSANSEIVNLLKTIIQLLSNLDFDFNLYVDSYELNKRIERIRNKNRFARNGG